MGSITIPNLDDALERRLRNQADSHGRPVEDEARDILHAAVGKPYAGIIGASYK